MAIASKQIISLIAGAVTVVAHGHVNNVVMNGVYFQGYDPGSFPYVPNPPIVAGWAASNLDNGFIAPDAFQTSDIICHKNSTNGDAHIPTVDKTTLKFFKVDGVGYISGSGIGTWASDVLIQNNSTWLVKIPANLASGNYVLRHEIIALHSAGNVNGAQSYPQCFNLAVTGTGSAQPSGVLGTALYKSNDPGILCDLYGTTQSYVVPGPTQYTGFPSSVVQTSSVATATSTAIPG
ncbi:hypothetical protein INS49_015899 [Diaporthe citri]|uniref:uncharacterized protein n=1 Tax=Diaporthe citri TaxID=83186 RepID=UPI001C7EDF4D|nr:uncharacterized protein INS49_015899 [Diaporthe citri]KAG6356511.1 hypothetical protein INS49_015899 [Diaporthe citri]